MKVIINIEDGVDIRDAMQCVSLVIERGRVSGNGKRFCWATVFSDGLTVVTNNRTKSDSFTVYRNPKTE